MKSRRGFLRHWVPDAVLIPQLFFDLRVNLVDRLFLRHFEQSPARLARNLFQNFLSVDTFGHPLAATAPPATHRTAAHTKSRTPSAVTLVILEQNRIHDRVCLLAVLNRRYQRFAAPVIDAIR